VAYGLTILTYKGRVRKKGEEGLRWRNIGAVRTKKVEFNGGTQKKENLKPCRRKGENGQGNKSPAYDRARELRKDG